MLDVAGYFAPLRDLLEAATRQRFLRPGHRDLVIMDSEPGRLLDRLDAWQPVVVDMRCPGVSGQGSNRISPGKGRGNVGGTEKVQSGI